MRAFPAPGGDLLEVQWQAAQELGVRMHFFQGQHEPLEKDGGLPPDSVVQSVDEIMKDYHGSASPWAAGRNG